MRTKASEVQGYSCLTQLTRQAKIKAAQAFGQEDDITVLTVAFAPADMLSEDGAKSKSQPLNPERK